MCSCLCHGYVLCDMFFSSKDLLFVIKAVLVIPYVCMGAFCYGLTVSLNSYLDRNRLNVAH